MVKLYEKLTIDQVAQLVPEVRDALLELGSHGELRGVTGGSQFIMPRNWGREQEVSYPIIRYVHSSMMNQAKPALLPHPFTHTWFGHIAPLVRKLSDGLLTADQVVKLATQILGVLENNRLAKRMGKGSTKAFMVAPWPLGFEPHIYSSYEIKQSRRDTVVMEKRIKEEADPPVDVHFDPSSIPLPDPNPESILAYVSKLKQCFDKLNDKYEQTRKELDGLKREAEWGDIPKRLGEIVRGD